MSSGPESPFRGLSPFGDTDVDGLFFFGREREREIIVANVIASRLTVLYGPSGVGKSSVLNAAVVRDLRALPEQPVVITFARWSEEPVEVFDQVLAAAAADREVYVILDQLEEYFLYRESRNGFGNDLARLLSPALRVNLLMSVREDELAKLDRFKGSVPGLFSNVLRLDRLDRPAGRAAIVKPVDRWNELTGDGVTAEPELVEAVLDEVGKVEPEGAFRAGAVATDRGEGGIEAPFLQLVMQRLWDVERKEGSKMLRAETFRRLGGARTIVAEHLESAIAAFAPGQEDIAARLFHHLVTPSGTKIAHGVRDLAGYVEVAEESLRPVLATLATHRILRPLEGHHGSHERYEIFHDVLADPVLAWRAEHESARALKRERAEARRRHRRLAWVTVASLVALAVVAAIAVFALAQRSDARDRERSAQARGLAATALTQLGVDPELALLLGAQAAELEQTPRVEGMLREALGQSRVRGLARVPRVDALAVAGGRLFAHRDAEIVERAPALRLRTRHPLPGRFLGVHGGAALSLQGKTLTILDLADGEAKSVRVPVNEVVPVRDVESGVVRGQVRVPPIRLAAIGRNRTLLAASGGGGTIALVNLLTGEGRYELDHQAPVRALAFAPRSRLLASGGTDGVVRLWSVSGGTLFGVLRAPGVGRITEVAFSPRSTLLAAASADGTIRVWRVGSADPVAILNGHRSRVTDIAFSSDGRSLVSASTDGTARVWKAETGDTLAVLRGHDGAVRAAVFTPDGGEVITAGADGTIRRWDARAQRALEPLAQLNRPVHLAEFADARTIRAVTSDRRLHVLEPQSGKVRSVGRAEPQPTPSAHGLKATISGRTVTITGLDGETVRLDGHSQQVTSVAFSPDAKLAVTASRDGDVRVWETRTGELVRTLSGHNGAVNDAAFSPDGRWIVSAGPRTAALWETEDGRFIFYLSGHDKPVRSARFDPAGMRIVTASDDGTIRVYECEICASGPVLLEATQRRLALTGRTLTAAERERFLGER